MKVFTPLNEKFIGYSHPSVFLAGPTLRNNPKDFTPWREEAVSILESKGFKGNIFIPEPYSGDYDKQIDWEEHHLGICSCILFWIPRNMMTLPGLTTNVEFGEWMKSNISGHDPQVVLGFPVDAEHINYLVYKAKRYAIPMSNTLEGTIDLALSRCEE